MVKQFSKEQYKKCEEEDKLMCPNDVCGTFEGFNRFIQTHNVDWKSEVCRYTTLHIACRFGYMAIVEHIIKDGSDINAKDYWRLTPLSYAVKHSHHKVITLLLENNAKVSVQRKKGNSDLHDACYNDDLVSVRLLLEHGAFPNFQDKFHEETPLHVAVRNIEDMTNSVSIVKLLVEFYADIRIKSIGETPGEYAKNDYEMYVYEDQTIEERRIEIKDLLEKEEQFAPLKRRHSYIWLKNTWKSLSKMNYLYKQGLKPKAAFNKRPKICSGF